MANNGNLEILRLDYLKALENKLVFTGVANSAIATGMLQKGDKVKINQVPNITVSSYTGADITSQAIDPSQSILEITEDKYWSFDIDTVDYANIASGLATEATRKAAFAQMNNIDVFMAGKYAEAGIQHYTAASPLDMTSLNVEEAFLNLAEKFAEAGVLRETRKFAIVPPWVTTKLGLAGIKRLTDNVELYARGYYATALGFDFIESNNVSKNSSSWDITKIIAGVYNESFAYAAGLSVIESAELENKIGKTRVKGRFVYGGKIMMPDRTAVFYADKTAEA